MKFNFKLLRFLACLAVVLVFVGGAFANASDMPAQTTVKAEKSYPYQTTAQVAVFEQNETVSGGEIRAITTTTENRFTFNKICENKIKHSKIDYPLKS